MKQTAYKYAILVKIYKDLGSLHMRVLVTKKAMSIWNYNNPVNDIPTRREKSRG